MTRPHMFATFQPSPSLAMAHDRLNVPYPSAASMSPTAFSPKKHGPKHFPCSQVMSLYLLATPLSLP